ncbi:MAG: hypothetical protein K9J16_07385 [Melioribacteraceae bacterium]|nr:hypothetical protein [Melioribacteraceae bacterium]MCF8353415.1 hypothetical protein [Melioribacteraceae bacterium]MCF8396488.1 hypothetical protein [Melioribacteraceae bacterium]MCF8418976.1 hypothetical protein [Melioribacteraceae bacterium]
MILLINSICSSQINPGSRQIALSHSTTALSNDVFAIFNNPSGLAQLNWRELGVYYSPSPFGLKELANGYAAYNEPFEFGNLAAGFMTYGFELYRENKFLLSFSKRFYDNFFAGISLIYQSLKIERYGNDGAFNMVIGGLAYLSPNIRLGFSIENLMRSTYGNEDDQIPVIYNSGLSYNPLTNISLNISAQKELNYPASFRFGIEYNLLKYVYIRSGIMNEPDSYSAGIGINYLFFNLDYAVFTHNDLGLTHQAGLIIYFNDDTPREEKIRRHLNLEM